MSILRFDAFVQPTYPRLHVPPLEPPPCVPCPRGNQPIPDGELLDATDVPASARPSAWWRGVGDGSMGLDCQEREALADLADYLAGRNHGRVLIGDLAQLAPGDYPALTAETGHLSDF